MQLQAFVSHKPEVSDALAEISAQFDGADSAFLLVFADPRYVTSDLNAGFDRFWQGVPVYGCSTAGEIAHAGYSVGSIVVIAFPKAHFAATPIQYDFEREKALVEIAERTRLADHATQAAPFPNRFGILLVDGVSGMEDVVAAAVELGLDNKMPVFGGSAADGMAFERTSFFCEGRAHHNGALLLMVSTDYDLVGIGFDHFEPTDVKAVVTGAIPERRLLSELNGAPAATEYARLIGKTPADVTPSDFAENPLLVRSGDKFHVRSIKEFTKNDQIAMLAAIDYGLVFNLGQGKEIIKTLVAELASVTLRNQKPEMIIGFDCVLRKLEIIDRDLGDEVSAVLRDYNVVGFNTYGEQYIGVHVNQTFVGVALFPPTQTMSP